MVRIELKDQKFYKDYHERAEKENVHIVSPKIKEFSDSRAQPSKNR